MLDCKKALEATNGDMDAAIDWLREKGISKAAKKADRIAAEGLAAILVDGNNAAIVEVNSETDFVAKNPEFQDLVNTILKTIISNDAKDIDEAFGLIETVEKTAQIYMLTLGHVVNEIPDDVILGLAKLWHLNIKKGVIEE